MSYQEAAHYRRRAAHLRSLSHRMTSNAAMSLHLHTGVDTWYGPRADSCTTDLARAQQNVRDAADDLIRQAIGFELRADELDAAARWADQARATPGSSA